MKKLLQSTIVRVVCQVLVLAMISTLIPSGLTTKAYAQSGSALGSDPAKKVGVVEFVNDSNKFGQIVSKNATDAFIMECNKDSKIFQVEASNEEIKAKMEELGIRNPASKLDCIAIANELGLDGIIQGYIKSVSVKGKGASKVASANVVIQYIDRASGEIIMGTNAKGESSARIGFTADEDTLVVEAIAKAISIAYYNLSNYYVPKATVQAISGENGSVMLNTGSRNNLYPGMRMVVMRGAFPVVDDNLPTSTKVSEMRVVGYIEVESVSGIDSTARIITQNVGVKPEDICIGLYNDVYISKYSPIEETQNSVNSKAKQQQVKARNNATNIGYIVLGVAAAIGLASLFSKSGSGGGKISESSKNSQYPYLVIKKNGDGYISNKIIGIQVRKNGGNFVQFWNGEPEEFKYIGLYDGKNDVTINLSATPGLELFDNEQGIYEWQWIYTWVPTGKEAEEIDYTKVSDQIKMTNLSIPYDLNPTEGEGLTPNDFTERDTFIWECDAYSGGNLDISYKVEYWDISSSSKKSFETNQKYANKSQLTEIYNYIAGKDYKGKTFAWRVGVKNLKDTYKDYVWSDPVRFTVDELPPAPPKGIKR